MKNLLLLSSLCSFGISVCAQTTSYHEQFRTIASRTHDHLLENTHKPLAKTTATTERVIGKAQYFYNSAYYIHDSSAYKWAWARTSHVIDDYVDIRDYDLATHWEGEKGHLHLNFKTIQQFNSDNLPIENLSQGWDAGTATWQDFGKSSFTYTGKNLTEYSSMMKNTSGVWENYRRSIFIYSGSDPVESYSQEWNSSLGVWEYLSSRATMIYSAGKLTERITYKWDNSTSLWIKNGKEDFIYSGSNLIERTESDWVGSWVPYMRHVHTYSGSDLITTTDMQWNTTISDWKNRSRNVYSYSGGKKIEDIYEYWTGTAWLASYKYSYTYTGGNLTESVNSEWNAATSTWLGNYKAISTYNTNNSIVNYRMLEWNGTSWQPTITTGTMINYYYEPYSTSVAEMATTIKNSSLFPNPASTNVYVDYFTETNASSKVTLSNMLGQEIMSKTEAGYIGDHSVLFPVQSLAQGTYLVSIYSNGLLSKTLRLVR